MTSDGKSQEQTKRRRLSAALRENLKRRKAQARARAGGKTQAAQAETHHSAGIAEDKRKP